MSQFLHHNNDDAKVITTPLVFSENSRAKSGHGSFEGVDGDLRYGIELVKQIVRKGEKADFQHFPLCHKKARLFEEELNFNHYKVILTFGNVLK